LPLPDALPPACVHCAERIDSGCQLRTLGKEWGNCLGSYVWNVDNGQCAIYLWREVNFQAACHVTRSGRLGWFLEDVKGPQNSDIEQQDLDMIYPAFEGEKILPASDIVSISQLIAHDRLPWRQRRRLSASSPPEENTSLDHP
jgi:hypothetical protein